MNEINLSTSLKDFANYLLTDDIHDHLPPEERSKKYNTFFLYLCVSHQEEVIKKGYSNSSYKKFNVWHENEDLRNIKNKIVFGNGGFSKIICNRLENKNLVTVPENKNLVKDEKALEDKNLVKDEKAKMIARSVVQTANDLNSLINAIESSTYLEPVFINHVTKYIKPIFIKGIKMKKEDRNKIKTINKLKIYKEIKKLIDSDVKQLILTGPPGTGKTYIAQELSKELGVEVNLNNFVQFHPSFDYVDFIEGIRPFENANHEMIFRKTDGIFKSFCRHIAELNKNEENQSKKYFFIIDEINRTDLSKVFGELLFALEEDKRGQRISTQYSQLPTYYYDEEVNTTATYEEDIFKEGFFVPENIFILATMNDIDRSVEQIDFAFRRRFKWIQVNVEEQSLRDAFESGEFVDNEHINGVIEAITQLNEFIKEKGKEFQLNENYFISQGYFKNLNKQGISDLNRVLEHAWDIRIKLTIAEYVRGEINAEVFLEQAKNTFLSPSTSTDPIES